MCRYKFAYFILSVVFSAKICDGQFFKFKNYAPSTTTALPFPSCRADDIDCLRRGLRTFFFLMDSHHLGMAPVDPVIVNSVAVALPDQQLTFLLRRINVTGARWTKLIDRKFNLMDGKSGVRFKSDLHIEGEITMRSAQRIDPFIAHLTMDIYEVESNVTYFWRGVHGIDNEDYILVGPERIAVRNTRTPSFFLQPKLEESNIIEEALHSRTSVLEHLSNEITHALMSTIVDNFRMFASKIPVRNYYQFTS